MAEPEPEEMVDRGDAAAAVVHPVAVRGLLRGCRASGIYEDYGLERRDPRGRRGDRARLGARLRRRGLRGVVGAPWPGAARGGHQHHQHRPGVPAQRHPAGGLRRLGHHHRRRISRAARSATGASATSSSCWPACASNGLDPASDVQLVQQNFDMLALISGEIDAAQAMIYNEYAQVLETVNPDTGELYQPVGPQHHQLERCGHGDAAGRAVGRRRPTRRRPRLP